MDPDEWKVSRMNARQLNSFRKQLVNEVARLSLNRMTAERVSRDHAESAADIIDKAALEEQINFAFRLREREKLLGRKIRHALIRIEEGTYGICLNCGEDIPIARLRARPVTDHCFDCKTRMEARERALESGRPGAPGAGW
jgi:DnaK suppressor protein